MCGIAGFIGIKRRDFDALSNIKTMVNTMEHRGPDDMGYFVVSFSNNRQIGLGHRRLKIIDLSEKGHQPMFNQSETVGIIYNGEIYNYLELKDELIRKGYDFLSTSDTEVILKAYEEWGTDCFSKFNGMWAMAIFDKKQRKIILSRDRLGKKPLYFYKAKDDFIFASEIKAILKHPHVIKEPNYEKIFRYISTNYRYIDIDEQSYFKNILQVNKSSFMEIDENLNIRTNLYWRLEDNSINRELTEAQAVQGFRDLLIDSVNLRLRSDVPVGCMLSGGLDSTSITCIAYKALKQPIVAFSGITGDVKGVYDETEYIEAVINENKAKSYYIRTDPADLFETINEMLYFHDEPICTVTWHSLYLIAKKVKLEKTPVLLNGHGGDELLAGYWDHYHYFFYELQKNGETQALKKEIECWKENHGRGASEIGMTREYIDKMLANEISEMSRFRDYSSCLKDEVSKKYKRDIRLSVNLESLLNRRLYSELLFETVPASLRPEDRNSMSQSLESRSPFLDYRLIEYCFSLPGKFKIRNGLGKWILREAMKGILPEKVRTRKDKAGFIAPADEWFRTTNKKQVYDLINSISFKDRGIFNIKRINEVFDEHLRKKANHQMFLWQIINTELWFRRFFDEQ